MSKRTKENIQVVIHESSEPVSSEEKWTVTEEDNGVHVRPFVDGDIVNTEVEKVISYDELNESKEVENEKVQEETLLVDDRTTSREVPEEQKTETEVEVRIEKPIIEIKTETVVEPITTEEKPKSKEIDFIGRGFKSIKEAHAFINTNYFKGLGKEDQEEYLNWLKS